MTDDIFPGDGPLTREEMGAIVLSLDARYQQFVAAVERQMQAATAELVATLEASL